MKNWVRIDAPKRKADWRYKWLRLLELPPAQAYDWANDRLYDPLPIQIGDVARIYMRRKYIEIDHIVGKGRIREFGIGVIELRWPCPHCRHEHAVYIPEPWIAQGKAEFVEPVE